MSAVVKDGSICTGHGCFPPRTNLTSSSKFFIEGRGAVRVGDVWMIHCCETCHIGIQATGSKKMFIEGRPVARIGDFISCGSKNLTGSFRMFCNG